MNTQLLGHRLLGSESQSENYHMVPSPVTRNMNDQKLDGIILMPQLFQGIDGLADIESSKYSAEKKNWKKSLPHVSILVRKNKRKQKTKCSKWLKITWTLLKIYSIKSEDLSDKDMVAHHAENLKDQTAIEF